MKFLFATAMVHYSWAGSEELWAQSAFRLLHDGHMVSALVPQYTPLAPRIQQLYADGAQIRMLSDMKFRRPMRVWRAITANTRTGLHQDLAWIKNQQPDLVCISNGNYFDGLRYMDFCAANQIPFVGIAQANAEWIWPSDDIADQILKAYDKARGVFFVSNGNLRLAELQLGALLPRAAVVRNPFNVSWTASPVWPDDNGYTRLACVARYEPSAKGQDLLFEMMASDKWRQRPVTVSLFGAGPMEKSLKRLVKKLGLEDKIFFRGHLSDVESIWREHHALILPSRYEGLPLAIVEAMLCGRPCIVTDVAGNGELIDDNKTGFIAAAPTVSLLDEAFERAWIQRRKWQEIGKQAELAVRQKVPADPAGFFADCLLKAAKNLHEFQ